MVIEILKNNINLSQESLGRDETPRQTFHELFFQKYSSHLL